MSLARAINHRLPLALQPVSWATKRYLQWSGLIVRGGPFHGMRYIDRAYCSLLAPKIAGTYEQELQPHLRRLVAARPDAFIDVGAAEGYYAVGAVLGNWSPRVIAFEADPEARAALGELMQRNGVDPNRLEIHGACTSRLLNDLLQAFERPALMMDAEGFESVLLDPLRIPALARCTLLVEHHDFLLPGLADEIVQRMSPSHEIEEIGQTPRISRDFVCDDLRLRFLPSSITTRILREFRPFHRHGWFWMSPKNPRRST